MISRSSKARDTIIEYLRSRSNGDQETLQKMRIDAVRAVVVVIIVVVHVSFVFLFP